MLCLAVASGKLFGSLWKAEDQESPARTPSLGVSEEISDLVDIETVASPLRRLLKEAESDSTEAEDDESSNDENIDEDDEEDEDGTEDNNGFMQNRAVQVSGAAIGGGLVCGLAVNWLKKGASVKTPQGIAVTLPDNLSADAVTALNNDSNVLSTAAAGTTIYTMYDTFPNFQKKHTAAAVPGASESNKNYAVFALQGFEEAELTTVKKIGMAPKDSITDRVILDEAQINGILATKDFKNNMQVTVGPTDTPLHANINLYHMIITKAPTAPAAAP